ncbi:hypothetical protein [Botryobacter ruber]|uniref:hypothetical protein n=1 Tax=Botryobacter ruber TaxID=2171629 RepID=UPI000E0A59C2|nr:hypothetical protein [Botryobacter ruber]
MSGRFLCSIFLPIILFMSCRDNSTTGNGASDNPTMQEADLPPDVLEMTKPLIKGRLYKEASLEQGTVINFDTSQQILVLDTTDALFVKARIVKDTSAYTGYVLKAILPE